jgi:hypothetical protein
MQEACTSILYRISTSKPKLLSIMAVLVIAILALPAILPHLTHPYMIYRIFLYVVSVILAILLTIVSFLAYKRNNSKRILFMTFDFISLTATELLSHVILFVMLTLFGIGVLKVTR